MGNKKATRMDPVRQWEDESLNLGAKVSLFRLESGAL